MAQPYNNYDEWKKAEGGIEHPTHLETLQRPEQQARIQWLKDNCSGSIIEFGCNWGYVLNAVSGEIGLDINPENIELAKKRYPDKVFLEADITKEDYPAIKTNGFDTVIIPDVLEHIEWKDVKKVIAFACRVARCFVLITIPIKQSPDFAQCFKHQWIPEPSAQFAIFYYLEDNNYKVYEYSDGNFIYYKGVKDGKFKSTVVTG